MRLPRLSLLAIFLVSAALTLAAQTQKPLTNADILNMTKQGFNPSLIVKDIQTSTTDFDTSPQALIDLKNASVDGAVMEAMLSAQANKPTGVVEAVRTTTSTTGGVDPAIPTCTAANGCLVREGTVVLLKSAAALNSKTAVEGDSVEFFLDEDLKVGDSIVIPKGAHAVATVSDAKKAGMLGRPGELSIHIDYVAIGSNHVRLRGNKGREGDSRTGSAVALTVLFGPVGLIKHGKNVEIPAGTAITAYVDQDVWLAAIK
jgi:hypothetical protein